MYRGRDLQRFTRGDLAYILVPARCRLTQHRLTRRPRARFMAPVNARPLHALRRHTSFASSASRLALCLLLVAPLCSAACGGHVNAPSEPMVAEAHVDCHGMATMEATDDAEEAHAEADAAADECCDATDSTRPSERADMLPAAVALLTSAEWLWTERASPARARPPPSGQGRSPGRTLLLLIVSFLE